MRNRFAVSFLILSLGGLILLLDGTEGYAQRGGGQFKFGGPPGGFKGDFKFDPGRIFQFIAKGRDTFDIKDSFRDREVLELFAKQNGITDGKINQQQFVKYWEQRDKLREEVRKSGGGGAPAKGGGPGRDRDPDAQFKRLDTNGDGFLNEDEISQSRRLKEEWQKWDTNKDGRLSLDEYKAYAEARAREREARRDEKKDGDKKDDKKDGDKKDEKQDSITRIELEEVENVRPIVYYAGNLPKEGLPDWFTELDANKDGQVSLMEWMRGGKSMSDFARWDHNDDGLITPEEALRQQKLMTGAGGGEKVAGGPNGKGPRAFPGPGGNAPRMFKGGPGGGGRWMRDKKGRKPQP